MTLSNVFLRPSLLISLAAHGAVAALGFASLEEPPLREAAWLTVVPADVESPPEDAISLDPTFARPDMPVFDPEPGTTFPPAESVSEFPDLPAEPEFVAGPPVVRWGLDVPTPGILARRPTRLSAVPATAAPSLGAASAASRNRVGSAPVPSASNRPPPYPHEARQRGWEGVAVFRVLVKADGSVAAVALESSTGYDVLDRAAEAAVRAWSFAPSRVDGVATDTTVRLPVVFRLS